MLVEYITHMGDDLMVVDAARVSFDKSSEWVSDNTPGCINCPGPNQRERECYECDRLIGLVLSDKDTKLINYLAKNGHWSPFSHPQIQIRVTAPVFLAAQLKRHTVGLSLNEVSRRYVDDEPTFYIPDKWRGRPPGSIKQGSSDEEVIHYTDRAYGEAAISEVYTGLLITIREMYEDFIKAGVAPEMARMVLPQSMNTSWIWTGSLLAFIRIYKQRIDSHSQLESQMIAKQIGEILETYFPVSFKAWTTES